MRAENFDVEVIIGYRDGNMMSSIKELIESEYEGMTYEDLTEDEKEELTNRLDECQGCGWTFDVQSMEEPAEDAGLMCWRCVEDYCDEESEFEDTE